MRTSIRSLAVLAFAALSVAEVHAQSREQLLAENARLKAQVAAQHAAVPTDGVAFAAESMRVGPAAGFARGHVAAEATIKLSNTGNQPIALNYEQQTFALVDDKGYQYTLTRETSAVYYKENIKGISMATRSTADTADVLLPGQSRSVTFIGVRYMRDGEHPGTRFDLTATFGQYVDAGEGRVRKVRTYPVALHDLVATGSTANVGDAVKRGLDRLFGH